MYKKIVLAALAAIVVLCLSGCGGGSKPISVAITASSSTVDGLDSVTLTATVSHDKNSAGVSWNITSGGGELSNTTTTSATYTAPAGTSAQQTITITATSVANSMKTADITITVAALPAVTTTSASLAGSVGTTYSITLQASGGIAPYTWALANGVTLPSCLTLNSSGVITTTSGTAPDASCAGTYSNLTFTVTDSGTPTPLTATSAPLTITITAPLLTFPTSLAGGSVGVAYSASAAAIGALGAATYSLASGALPPDLSLNTSTGAITGTPKASDAGTFTFTVKVVDAFGDTATSGSLSIKIIAPTITFPASLPGGTVGTAYTGSVAATGPVGATTYSLASGALPADLSLNSSTGAITGTPKASDVGTFTFTVKVVDAYGDTATSGSLSIAITAAPAITFGVAPTATATAGVAYSSALSASGGAGALTYNITSGSLPTGLSLNTSTGAITGTPTTVGPATFTAKVQDAYGDTPATQSYTITVNPGAATHFAVALTSSSTITAGGTVSFKITALDVDNNTATGYSGTVMFTSSDAQAALPANSTLASGVGSFSATLKTAGSQTITATDTTNATVTGTSSAVTVNPGPAASLMVAAPATATTNVAFSFTVTAKDSYNNTATGYAGTVHFTSTDGSAVLPSNSGLTNGTGAFSATLKTTGSQTITATDTSNASITGTSGAITVANTVTITTASINPLDVGQAATQTLTGAGGSGNSADYSWSWAAASGSSIPPGLSLSTAGAITGTPTTAGTYTVSVTVKDTGVTPNQTYSQNFTVTIYNALSLPASSTLPAGYTGVGYNGGIAGSGGSGSYCYTVPTLSAIASGIWDGLSTDLPNSVSCGGVAAPTNYSFFVGGSLQITGTPTNPPTPPYDISFNITLIDLTTGASITRPYSISITAPTPVGLPAANPTSLPSATINQSYSGSITATGGVSPYTWSVNGVSVPSGTQVTISDGIYVSDTGGSTLTVGGTPTSTGTVTLTNVKVVDAANSNATATYTIAVNNTYSISGQYLPNNFSFCNGTTPPNLPTVTVTLEDSSGNTVQTTTTQSDGSYTFTNVANGTYTIHPSITGSGAEVLFFPAVPGAGQAVVNNANVTGMNVYVSLGYTVSGAVTYSGTTTAGQVYVDLVNDCGASGGYGTSIAYPFTSGGAFTIHGVPPGNYTLYAAIDPSTLAEGGPNIADPTGNTGGIVVTGNLGTSVTVNDPTGITTTSSLHFREVAPENSAVVISYGGVGTNGAEIFTSYTVQWSTTTTGFSSSNQATFKAIGTSTNIWIVDQLDKSFTGSLNNGNAYYFRAMGTNSAGNSPWVYWGGPGVSCSSSTGTPACAITVTIGAPSEPDTVSGTIYIPSNVTVNSGAVLYAGLYDENTSTAYAEAITTPTNAAGGNAFTVNAPNGSDYILFGILDQNDDGMIDTGDDSNVANGNNGALLTVSGNLTGQNVTLPSTNAISVVQTDYSSTTTSGGASTSYALNFNVESGVKRPVAVQLTGGPNVFTTDMGVCQSCGRYFEFQDSFNLDLGQPAVGQSFTFNITYSDGTTDTGVTAAVTGWNGGTTLVGNSNLVTNMLPSGNTGPSAGTRTEPTFTWTDPSVDNSTDVFGFGLINTTATSSSEIWQIPSSNSNLNGFPSTIQSITWGVDPTDSSNVPTVSSLTTGDNYLWWVETQDSNGNQAWNWMYYVP